MKRAVLYSRVSTILQADHGVSLEMQEDMARAVCSREGWEYLGPYTDTTSGTKDDRTHLARLEADAGAKRFEVVLVYKTDRLARSLLKLLQVAADFHDRGIALVSMTEPIDFSTPMGKALLAMLGAFAEMESRNIASRVRDSLRLVAVRGGRTGSPTRILGYQWSPDAAKYLSVPDEAATVRALYETYLTHMSFRATANALNVAGYRTQPGNKFSAAAVREVVLNPMYRGAAVWGRRSYTRDSKGATRMTMQPEREWIVRENAHEAIIDPDTWARANDLAVANQRRSPRSIYALGRYAWAGLITCAGCGASVTHFRSAGRPRRDGTASPVTGYECFGRKAKGHAHCQSPAYLTDTFLHEVAVPAIAAHLAALQGERKAPARRQRRRPAFDVQRAIDEEMGKKERALVLYQDGLWPYERARQAAAEADARIEAIKANQAPEVAARQSLPPLIDWVAFWERSGEKGRGELLRLYFERAEADKGKLVLHFHSHFALDSVVIERVSMRGHYGRKMKGQPRSW